MVRFAPLTLLALTPLAQARFDWLQPRGAVDECSYTVTVTEPARPQKTLTVTDPQGGSYRTVTVQEPGESYTTVTVTQYNEPRTKFVYISQGETLDPPKETITITHPGKTVTVTQTESEEYVVTKKINVYPNGADYPDNNDNGNYYPPGAKTITVTNGYPAPSAGYPAPSAGYPGYEGGVVTKVIGGNGEKYYDNAQTVTVVKDGEVKTLTFTHFNYNTATTTITQQNGEEEVVTVTGDYKVVETITEQDGENKVVKTITVEESIERVVTKTIKESGKVYTVIVTPEPTITTITKENGNYVTTVVEVPCTYTLTAPAQYETATVKGNSYKTVTRTATYGSGSEVEIIVYDPKTGYSTCERKKDGQPCHSGYENPAYTNTRGSNSSQTSIDVPNYTKVRPHDDDNNAGVYDPEETDCDEAAVSTSIATVYNTVIVTVGGEPTTTATQSAKQTLGYRDLESSNKRRSAVSIQW
ncbi:uncharacterized protein NECHADRAFT_34622 [Fusarium vanettenii 77-13-4]|uniref:Uncharacterized protein n=1 Tax=Fusarium vanettenii (strain ATCC MYA-4622 / CBS 123669 / FGSC 9596 / NRRL 45880 / 77-13-4) TaxID=660122 RepID=C7ZC65_FUSV7|nr:uncharacterized protein NECHADRAFT_34622 [Fusarium vanettenii 77-13-4]EEU38207.1 hypothetical protein NECHADRAFT_34622 [Fusarium vanettenii 77-13-4]